MRESVAAALVVGLVLCLFLGMVFFVKRGGLNPGLVGTSSQAAISRTY